ncbi:MAG TPA: hypothetical protein VFW79_04290, partial [Cellulomonas sp.]|nr:hypothetical protein [Cellulomonas sp.]
GDVGRAYGPTRRPGQVVGYGTAGYDGHPASLAEYIEQVGDPTRGDHERFSGTKQPVYVRGNVYAGGAEPYEAEDGPLVLPSPAGVTIVDEGDQVFLEAQLPDEFATARVGLVTGRDLERVRFVDADFEERDGTPVAAATDLVGTVKAPGQDYAAGPIAALAGGTSRTRVW